MTARVRVTAGSARHWLHLKRAAVPRDALWEPSKRDSPSPACRNSKTVLIDGPYNVHGVSVDASRKRLFTCTAGNADDAGCAILTNFARRAYPRPVTIADVDAPLAFYKKARQTGCSFDDGCVRAGVAVFSRSPNFFVSEKDPADAKPGVAD